MSLHIHRPRLYPIDDSTAIQPMVFGPQDLATFKSGSELQAESLSMNIDEGNASLNPEQIDAYPDIWARVLLFEDALYDPDHKGHMATYQEWCGLLTLFALALGRNLTQLKAEEVDLSDSSVIHPFIDGMKRMLPLHKPLMSQRPGDSPTPWTYLCLFFLDGQVIGLTSPRTLVCSAAEYQITNANVSWVDARSKRLTSPLGHLREQEYADLLFWLAHTYIDLKDRLGNAFISPGKRPYSLAKLFLKFSEDLCAYLHKQVQDPKLHQLMREMVTYHSDAEERLLFFHTSLQRDIHLKAISPLNCERGKPIHRFRMRGIYAPFEQVVSPPSVSAADSPVRIVPSNPLLKSQQTLLLLDPQLALTLNQAPSQVIVYNTISLASIDFGHLPNTPENMLNGQHLEDCVWKTPDAFFTDRLFYLEEPTNNSSQSILPGVLFPGSVKNLRVNNQSIAPLLPLRPEILNIFGTKELAQNVSFTQEGSQISVHLNLTLANGRSHTLSKSYASDCLFHISSPPAVDVWPNFRVKGLRYFTYYSNAGQIDTSFYVQPASSDRTQLEFVRYNFDGICAAQSLKGRSESALTDDPSIAFEICRTQEYPQALYCYHQESGVSTQTYIGVLALKGVPEITLDEQRTIDIGIDLGTSSTNVFMHHQGQYQPVVFEDPQKSLFNTVIASGLIMHYEEFLPKPTGNFKEHAPLLTLFKIKHSELEGRKMEAVLHGHVNFIDNYNDFDVRSKGIASDLKWSGDNKNRQYLPPFLEQLCLQATAKALQLGAGKVSLSFSYPSAFSEADRASFNSAVKSSAEKVKAFFPRTELKGSAHEDQYLMRENVATTYFFASGAAGQPPQFQRGAVILDIGGGTTDISIIEGKNNEFRYLGSVKYAGRDIFLESLLAYPEYLKHLGIQNEGLVAVQRGQKRTDDQSWVYAQLDAKIKGMSDLMQGLPLIAQDIQPMIHQMAVGVAGLLFYVGSIIQHLRATGNYTATDELPRIYIGGNGAKVFHWFNYGEYHKGCAYDGLFEAALRHLPRTALDAQPQLALYPTPLNAELGAKPEVAYGLVMNRDRLTLADVPKGYRSVPVAGETFTLNGPDTGEYPAHALLGKEQVPHLATETLQGQELTTFIDIVNSYASELDLPRIQTANMVREVTGDLQQHMNEIQQKIRRDEDFVKTLRDEGALFIHELKLLLSYLPGGQR